MTTEQKPKLRQEIELDALVERYGGDRSKALRMMSKLIANRKDKKPMSSDQHGRVVLHSLLGRYDDNFGRATTALAKINAARAAQGKPPLDENNVTSPTERARRDERDGRTLMGTMGVIHKMSQPLQQAAADPERAAERRYAELSDKEQRTILSMRETGTAQLRSLSAAFSRYDAARERVLSGRVGRQFGGE